MKTIEHEADFCVVGGGLSGLCAAVAAARHCARTVLMQDRPVLGGNASSEIRMWVCGARGENVRETGIVHELLLENRHRNPGHVYAIWDSILYECARYQDNLTLLLNCSCHRAGMQGDRIVSVEGWQGTAETRHRVQADIFADCSGDAVLAPLTGADFRIGRESREEFGEDMAQDRTDSHTMGMSCLFTVRETDRPQPYTPPPWAYTFKTDEDLPARNHDFRHANFWWIELGGDRDSIHDTEDLRDELLKIAFGVWDHIKNQQDHGADNWVLDWVGFLPGKRESRRYEGDYMLSQVDIEQEGRFQDIVAYHGWGLDDHHPAGFNYRGKPNRHPHCPSPNGIPFRCLYSRNIENLMFAGRNISATHIAMSSTRVMATCGVIGQAVGTAAAMAADKKITPRELGRQHIEALQQQLMEDDCWIPWHRRAMPGLSLRAELRASQGDPEPLRNGHDRPIGEEDNGWRATMDSAPWLEYRLPEASHVLEARFVFDSDLNLLIGLKRINSLLSQHPLDLEVAVPPPCLLRDFHIEAQNETGTWETVAEVRDNRQRLCRVPVDRRVQALRFVPRATWGDTDCHLFAWDIR